MILKDPSEEYSYNPHEDITLDSDKDIRAQRVSNTEEVKGSQDPTTDKLTEQPIYKTLEIKDSIRFLTLFDPLVKEGTVVLHKWQVEVNEDISYGRTRIKGEVVKQSKPDSKHPYKYCLCAANGSGKDAFVIAPLVLWFITTKVQSKVIVTSASGTQLTTQTEAYIRELANNVNQWTISRMGFEILKVNKRHIYCTLTGSVCHLFATDEGEKAEGHHPTTPVSEMMIVVNEAKSVTPEIFDALRRCTGYNYWVNVSSPGEPRGAFHKAYTSWPNTRRVSYFDCPHQSPDEFELDRVELGEFSPLFRSKWLALFAYVGGNYVISKENLDECRWLNKQGQIKHVLRNRPIRIGLDIALSGYGDETVVSVWQGNKQKDQKMFRIQNATALAPEIERVLLLHVKKDHNFIFADDGGVGRAVIDILNSRGWKINRVLNNSAAKNKKQFKNRGAQLWYKIKRLFELKLLIPLEDDKLYEQLASRKFRTSDVNATVDKLLLESKRESIAAGLSSPDRADAMVLAFTDANIEEFNSAEQKEFEETNKTAELSTSYDISSLKQMYRRGQHKQIEDKGKKKKMEYSQAVMLKRLTHEQNSLYKFQRN